MYSQAALIIYAAKCEGLIKSNAQFWREHCDKSKLKKLDLYTEKYEKLLKNSSLNLTCIFDDDFPAIPLNLKLSEKPYFFAYKGDISLLKDRANNVAIVGTLTPNGNIITREKEVVKRVVGSGYNIVSGLAVGCDTVAHRECLLNSGKTIAFLPSTLENIYPGKNTSLALQIIKEGGLVITEYVTEPSDRYQRTKQFIERDRLQAMFADKIILIASSLPGNGDSGSRHAMAKAEQYNTKRFVMYNEAADKDNPLFGLNRQFAESGTTVLTANTLKNM